MILYSKEVGVDFLKRSSRISSKGQVTIPKDVRERLELSPGDLVGYDVEGDDVVLRKIEPFERDFHTALESTLSEWASPEDEEAFGDL